MPKMYQLLRNILLVAAAMFLALAVYSLAVRYVFPAQAIFVLLFWFVAVPVVAYYVAFKLNLRKQAASSQAIAGLVLFYVFVLGMTYRFTDPESFQIMAFSFLPSLLTVYYIQVIVRQLRKEEDEVELKSKGPRL